MAWRDEASLAAMSLMHIASANAMRRLEEHIGKFGVSDAISGADAAARKAVHSAMRGEAGATIDDWFNLHARILRRLDPRLEEQALRFAAMGQRPALPKPDAPEVESRSVPTWLQGPVKTIGSKIGRATTGVANRAVPIQLRKRAEQVSTKISREIYETSGLHTRLREAARKELMEVWLQPPSAPASSESFLTHLLNAVDRTTGRALEIIA